MRYQIVLDGLLDRELIEWFGGMIVSTDPRRETTELLVSVPDQAALHGILGGVRDLNLSLVLVRRLPEESRPSEAR